MLSICGGLILSTASCSKEHSSSRENQSKADDAKLDWSQSYTRDLKGRKSHYQPEGETFEERLKAARRQVGNNDFERAQKQLDLVIKMDPNCGEAYFLRGKAAFCSAFGDEEKAIADLEKAGELKYNSVELYEELAKLYEGKKQSKKAVAALSDAIKVQPGSRDLHKWRAAIYITLGDQESAMADYNSYIKMAPDRSLGYYLRGSLHERMNNLQSALDDYASTAKFDPKNSRVLIVRAGVLVKLGKINEAIAELTKAIAMDKYDDDALRQRGDLYMQINQYQKAVDDYTSAIKIFPEYSRASYEARSKAYDKLGKNDLAQKDRLEAGKLKDKPAEKPVYDLK